MNEVTQVHSERHVVRTSDHAVIEITTLCNDVLKRSGQNRGLLSVFLCHTSASLIIFENADPSAMYDLCNWLRRLAPEGDPSYTHTFEGKDDMPSHLRMVLTRTHETIPFHAGRLRLGTWQGLFLLEHRSVAHERVLEFTVVGVR